MALNFPDSPTNGQVYLDTTSGFYYEWDGVVWKSFTPLSAKSIQIIDNISGSFNDSDTIFSLAVSGTAIYPVNAQQLLIVLGGVVQEPGTDYTTSQATIVFTTPPSTGLTFSGISLGPAVPQETLTVSDGSITPAKLSTGGPSWNTSGDLYVSGIATITNSLGSVKVGVGTTTLIVEGDARVTGILTVGTASVTIDGNNSSITADSIILNGSTLYSGVGLATEGGQVGTGITYLDLRGAGVSTSFYDSNVGIATVFFEGGGGGSSSGISALTFFVS